MRHYGLLPLVMGQPIAAKSRGRLLCEEVHGALIDLIFSLASVVTPNLPEAQALTDLSVASPVARLRRGLTT